MINFIVCDDNKIIKNNIMDIIDRIMMKSQMEYNSYGFLDYDNEFMEIMNRILPNKVYILDIEVPSFSGIDIARMIRTKDYESTIIFLTSHDELGNTVLKNEFMCLTFICKFDNYEAKIISAIKKSVEIVNQKKIIIFKEHYAIYKIPIDDILYVSHDSIERKWIVKTDYTDIKTSKNLNELLEMLDSRFIQTHRSCIVNKNRIRIIDKKNKEIIFDNKDKIDLLSDKFKLEV